MLPTLSEGRGVETALPPLAFSGATILGVQVAVDVVGALVLFRNVVHEGEHGVFEKGSIWGD